MNIQGVTAIHTFDRALYRIIFNVNNPNIMAFNPELKFSDAISFAALALSCLALWNGWSANRPTIRIPPTFATLQENDKRGGGTEYFSLARIDIENSGGKATTAYAVILESRVDSADLPKACVDFKKEKIPSTGDKSQCRDYIELNATIPPGEMKSIDIPLRILIDPQSKSFRGFIPVGVTLRFVGHDPVQGTILLAQQK